jgi:alkylation response protein AidB-like acyl-CoA dehydrogenase
MATAAVNDSGALPLVQTDEERLLRESVRGIASKFGPEYFIRVSDTGEWPGELWDAFVEKGFVGVHIPEQYGGGGQGLSECAVIYEESSAAGCALLFMVLTPGITGSILTRHCERGATSTVAHPAGAWRTRCARPHLPGGPNRTARRGPDHARVRAADDPEGGGAYDAGLLAGEASNMAKFMAAEAGIHAVDHAIQTHGGNGFAKEYQLAAYYFLARLLRVAPVSREVLLNNIAGHRLGLPRSFRRP